MNVGIVTTWFERGAAYVSRQYRDILKDSFNVLIYARGGEYYAVNDPVWDNSFVTWGKPSSISVPTAIDETDFHNWLKTNSIELVIFNEQWWWPPVLWCKKLGIKTCAYVDYYTEETIPLFTAFDALFCNTLRHIKVFSWHAGAHYIPWGTDINIFKPSSFCPVSEGIVTFFHSSGMNPHRKGTDLVLRAFEKVNGDCKLVIHTQISLFDIFPDLTLLINNLIENKRLEVLQATVPAPGYYHLGDVYVYPSRLEGVGLTIAEALSCGLPVIVPDNPPMNEFLDDHNGRKIAVSKLYSRSDGYYWPQCEVDIVSLTCQMQSYSDSLDILHDLKKSARKYAEDHLNWDNNKQDILNIIHSIEYTVYDDINKILSYEAGRNSVINQIQNYSPLLFKLLQMILRIKKQL